MEIFENFVGKIGTQASILCHTRQLYCNKMLKNLVSEHNYYFININIKIKLLHRKLELYQKYVFLNYV